MGSISMDSCNEGLVPVVSFCNIPHLNQWTSLTLMLKLLQLYLWVKRSCYQKYQKIRKLLEHIKRCNKRPDLEDHGPSLELYCETQNVGNARCCPSGVRISNGHFVLCWIRNERLNSRDHVRWEALNNWVLHWTSQEEGTFTHHLVIHPLTISSLSPGTDGEHVIIQTQMEILQTQKRAP